MRKNLVVLLFAAVMLVSACSSEQNDILLAEKSTDTMDFCLNVKELRAEETWNVGDTKVYFGQFEGNAMVYRVLPQSPDTQIIEEGKECLLLDCDSVLLAKEYDADNRKNDNQTKRQNEWKGSDLEAWLNSDEFYSNSDVFSKLEKLAIVSTTLAERSEPYSVGRWTYEDFGATDNIFLLSASEAKQLYFDDAARVKLGSNTSWWIRSAFAEAGNGAGAIHSDGHICNNSVMNYSNGVSHALNIDTASILFASTVGANEWKLTLLDCDKIVCIPDGQMVARDDADEQTLVTIPYKYTGKEIVQVSVMITDKAYKERDSHILFYAPLQGTSKSKGKATFTLPLELKNKICGKDYYAYIIAEDVNADTKTDYASKPCAITIPDME